MSDVAVVEVDPDTEVVTGTAGVDAPIQVWVHDDSGAFIDTVADGSGDWSVDFTSVGYDIVVGTQGGVAELDDDGDGTQTDWYVPNPMFTVHRESGDVFGNGWAGDTSVLVVLGDPTSPDESFSVMTDEFGNFGPSEFVSSGFGFGLSPGDLVTVDDATSTKDVVVSDVAVVEVDPDTEVVTGTAGVDAPIQVWVHDDSGAFIDTVADGSGDWSVDFTSVGYDIVVGTQGGVAELDDDGDGTQTDWYVPNPMFTVHRDMGHVWGNSWLPDTEVTVTLGDPTSPDESFTVMTDEFGNFGPSEFVDVGFGHGLVPGDLVTVDDGVSVKDLVVSDLVVVSVDPDTDTVTGTAGVGVEVHVFVHGIPDEVIATANGSGEWAADLSTIGIDIQPGTQGGAGEFDVDSDQTQIDWFVPNPMFTVQRESGQVWGGEWSPDTEVTVMLGDPTSPDESFSVMTDEFGNFGPSEFVDVGFGHGLVPDDLVTVDDGVSVKELVVSPIVVTSVDATWDVVSGTSGVNAPIQVWIHDDSGAFIETVADGSGDWAVDFTTVGYDLQLGTAGGAAEPDADGDQTQVDWRVRAPFFVVDPGADYISGSDWLLDDEVLVTVWDSTYTGAKWSDVVSTNPYGDFDVHIGSLGVDVIPGDIIEVSDSTLTMKTHTVLDLAVTAVDQGDDDVVAGTTDGPDTYLVAVWVDGGPADSTYPSSGLWAVDFSASGLEPGDQGGAEQFDDDGDATRTEWGPPANHFAVDPQHDQIAGWQWPAGGTVSVLIYRGPGIPFEWNGIPVDEFGNFWLDLTQDPVFDLMPGDPVEVIDETATMPMKRTIVNPLTLDEPVNPGVDTVSGTGDESMGEVFAYIHGDPGEEVLAVFDVDDWSATFSQTLAAGISGSVAQAEQAPNDGDRTEIWWGIPVPMITAQVDGDQVFGDGWAPGVTVDIVVDDPVSPSPDIVETATVDGSGWFQLDLGGVFDIQPDHVITVSHGTVVKELIVSHLMVDDVDVTTDTATGTASPFAQVDSWIHGEDLNFAATADDTGAWSIDYSGGWDIVWGDEVGFSEMDDDGDRTQIDVSVADLVAPTVSVSAPVEGETLAVPVVISGFGDGQ